MTAATVARASGLVPYRCMWRRATSANSAAVNIPNGATNSLLGRVQGAVAARSRYTPAAPPMMRTFVAMPAAMAVAACRTAGIPDHDDVTHTGESRAWYTKSLANCPTTPSTSRIDSPASASAPSAPLNEIDIESSPSSTRACSVLKMPEIATSWYGWDDMGIGTYPNGREALTGRGMGGRAAENTI